METIKHFFPGKGTNISKIALARNDKVISDDQQLGKTFFNFFQDVVITPGIQDDVEISACLESSDPVENIVWIYN